MPKHIVKQKTGRKKSSSKKLTKILKLIPIPRNKIQPFSKLSTASHILKQIKPRKTAPPKIKKWIKKNKNKFISRLVVCRKPLQEGVKKVLNFLSLGKFNKSLSKLNYDDVFHLYLYITIGNKTWRIEKNEVVTVVEDNKDKGEDCITIKMFGKRKRLGEFMANGEKHQKAFWSYHPKSNNCQDFVTSLLAGNGLNKEQGFIKQDAEAIFKNNPKYLSKFAIAITDVAGAFDFILNGFR